MLPVASRSLHRLLRLQPCPTGGPEEQWQRAIHERGEAVCPTCSVVTRKTLVGLKKHMEVCQKVSCLGGARGGLSRGQLPMARLCPQLQDALKCQHCRKQFKSKAGLNYHTMAEHSAKVCCQGPSACLALTTYLSPTLLLPLAWPWTQWSQALRSPCSQPAAAEASEGGEQEERERLRKVLKQMGRLRCPQEVSVGSGVGIGLGASLAAY